MSEGTPNDQPTRPMPWETGGTEPEAGEPPSGEPSAGEPPSDAAPPPPSEDATAAFVQPDATPTEVVPTPAAPAPAPPLTPQPDVAPPAAAGGLISAAPVWGAAEPEGTMPGAGPAPGSPPPAVGWGQPVSSGRDVPGAPGFVFADTPSRFVGWLIDGLIVFFISAILGTVFAAAVGGSSSFRVDTSDTTTTTTGIAFWIIWLVISLVYFVFFWTGGRRATPGQRLLKIQVGNAHDGRNLDVTQAAVRWVGYGEWLILLSLAPALAGLGGLLSFVWPFVLLITTIISPTKQGLHDRLGGSWVVKPADANNGGLVLGCLLLLILLIVLPLIAIIGLIFLGSQVSTILSTVGESI